MKFKLERSNRTDYWERYFREEAPDFVRQMNYVYHMEDTFGLCGIITVLMQGIVTFPDTWKGSQFDPILIKGEFDSYVNGVGELPFFKFYRDNQYLFKYELFPIRTLDKFYYFYRDLKEMQKIGFAIFLDYSRYGGGYTHWLTVLELYENKAIIGGDLTPLNVRDSFIREVVFEDLFEMIINTLDCSPTTNNSEVLKEGALSSGARDHKKFKTNILLDTFYAK